MTTINTGATLGSLVAEQPSRSRVLEQLGLDYCCGGKATLSDACAAAGLDASAVAAQIAEADAATPADTTADWTTAPLADLADHIEATHHAYLKSELPRITQLAEKVAQAHGALHPEAKIVASVYAGLRAELEAHLMKEEMILFPICRQLETAEGPVAFHCGSVANPIGAMEYEHDMAGEALAEMSKATNGYSTPDDVCNTYRALMDALKGLELDLHQHIHKENNILFPRAIEMESRLGR